MPTETKRITDVAVLRAIAHPMRLRLYERLTSQGPATATQLSSSLGVAANALSYHLRQLADHGFIREAPSPDGDRRERWWQVVPGGVRWRREDFVSSPATAQALYAADRVIVQRQLDRLMTWMDEGKDQWGEAWASAATSSDSLLWLTRDELNTMAAEVEDLITRWARKSGTGPTQEKSEDSERVSVFTIFHAFPLDEDGAGGKSA